MKNEDSFEKINVLSNEIIDSVCEFFIAELKLNESKLDADGRLELTIISICKIHVKLLGFIALRYHQKISSVSKGLSEKLLPSMIKVFDECLEKVRDEDDES